MIKQYAKSFDSIMLWMAVISVLCLTACAPTDSKIYQQRSYLLSLTPQVQHKPCLSTHGLEIHPCKITPPFDRCHLIYQRSKVEYESDPYHLFLVSPAEQVTHLLRQWYRGEYVNNPKSSDQEGDQVYILESFVDRLVTDFSIPDQPVACVRMHIQLSQYSPSGRTQVILLQKTYQAEQTLPARPAAQEIVIGLGECLQQILREFDTDCQVQVQGSTF